MRENFVQLLLFTSIAIIIVILFLISYQSTQECLVSRPFGQEKFNMAHQILRHQELFKGGKSNLENIRNKLNWMDAITYEDIRKLYIQNKLDIKNIVDVL